MDNLKIRRATKKDASIMAEYRFRMFRDMEPQKDFSKIREQFIKKSKEYYLRHISSKSQYDCVVQMGERIVACGTILFWERPPHIEHIDNSMGYILNVYVEREYRGKGISKKIMEQLHQEGRKRGLRKTGLHASQFGYPIYTSMGYRAREIYMELEL